MEINYKGILFDEFVRDSDGHFWAEICQNCANKYKNIIKQELDDGGAACGCCSVKGCKSKGDNPNVKHYYIDFKGKFVKIKEQNPMTELQFYNKKTRNWETAEENGKPIEFAGRYEAEAWLEEHHPEVDDLRQIRCFDYKYCDCCGKRVELTGFTNTCDCGADYNSFGQLLAPRSQWGKETGESVSDILAVDADHGEG